MVGSLENSELRSWHPTYPAVGLESPVLTDSLEVTLGTVPVSSPWDTDTGFWCLVSGVHGLRYPKNEDSDWSEARQDLSGSSFYCKSVR